MASAADGAGDNAVDGVADVSEGRGAVLGSDVTVGGIPGHRGGSEPRGVAVVVVADA